MRIAVCVKRVPDISEADVKVDASGRDVVKDRFQFTINEADNYALEEALLLKEARDGEVTLVTVGGPEAVEVLRMGLAKGAARGVRIDSSGFEDADGLALARVLAGFFKKEEFDLVLTGCIAQDVEDSQVGPALAEALGWPHAAYVINLEPEGEGFRVKRELEGGFLEVKELPKPCVLSIQTGGNTPRYASILGIKRAGSKPVDDFDAAGLGLADDDLKSRTRVERLFVPETESAAEFIEGDAGEKAGRLVEILKERGLA